MTAAGAWISTAWPSPCPWRWQPCTRYYWRVTVWADDGETATSDSRPGSKPPKWTSPGRRNGLPQIGKIKRSIRCCTRNFRCLAMLSRRGRMSAGWVCTELEINGKRVGDEYLTPGYNAYDRWIQYQTYDITGLLKSGANAIGAMLGNGWYKGRFGFEGYKDSIYGDQFALLCELVITCADGSTVVIGTDHKLESNRWAGDRKQHLRWRGLRCQPPGRGLVLRWPGHFWLDRRTPDRHWL